MSYGFYKLPPRSSHDDYIIKVAGKTMIAIAVVELSVTNDISPRLEPPKVSETLLHQEMDFRAQGYSGDICINCQGARLRWAGHCQVCEDCGTTTGCS